MAKKVKKTKKPTKKSTEIAVTTSGPINPRNMLVVIMQAAKSKDVEVAKMQALLDMQRQIMADQAKIDFDGSYIDMQDILSNIAIWHDGKIVITDKNDRSRVIQSTGYATYNNIKEKIGPTLRKFGFALMTKTSPGDDGKLHVKVILKHRGGYEESTVFPLALDTSGSKNNTQGAGSSQSYGRRFGAIGLLDLTTHAPGDRDLDGADIKPGHVARVTIGDKEAVIEGEVIPPGKADDTFPPDRPINAEQLKAINDAIAFCGVSITTFCGKYGIKEVKDLPSGRYQSAMDACKNYKR